MQDKTTASHLYPTLLNKPQSSIESFDKKLKTKTHLKTQRESYKQHLLLLGVIQTSLSTSIFTPFSRLVMKNLSHPTR